MQPIHPLHAATIKCGKILAATQQQCCCHHLKPYSLLNRGFLLPSLLLFGSDEDKKVNRRKTPDNHKEMGWLIA